MELVPKWWWLGDEDYDDYAIVYVDDIDGNNEAAVMGNNQVNAWLPSSAFLSPPAGPGEDGCNKARIKVFGEEF